ncbi:hypothetical protein Aperf_G00000040151 [Anoplocephala perfoliata]
MENENKLISLLDCNQWRINERVIMMDHFCLMMQAELNYWLDRDRLINKLFEIIKNQEPDLLEERSNNTENRYRLPLLKPPELTIPDQKPEQLTRSRLKRKPTPRGKKNTETFFCTPKIFNTGEDSPSELLFVTNAALTADELLTLINLSGDSKATILKKSKTTAEKKVSARKSERSKAKKAPPPPQPNQYLLGNLSKPEGEEFSFLYEISICALKVVQTKNEVVCENVAKHREWESVSSELLSQLRDQFQEEAPCGFVNQKRLVELIPTEALESAMKFTIPFKKDFNSTGQSEMVLVDWKRFIGMFCLREYSLPSDRMWSKLNSLRRVVNKSERRTLIDACLPLEGVKECIFGEESEQKMEYFDLFLSLFAEEKQQIKLDDLAVFIACFLSSSASEGLIRSLAVLQLSSSDLPDKQTCQQLAGLLEETNNETKPAGDFAISEELIQKFVDYVQSYIESGWPENVSIAKSRTSKIQAIFEKFQMRETPIQQLLCDSQFQELCMWMLPYFGFPVLN